LSSYWSGISTIFSVTGLSFSLSNRLSEISKRYIVDADIGGRMRYACFSTTTHHCQGDWGKIKALDEDLLNSSLRIGEFFCASNYLWWYGLVKAEQGEFGHLMKIIDKCYEIGEIYDYTEAFVHAQSLKADYFLKTRRVNDALSEAEQGILYSREKSTEYHEIMFMAYKAEAQQLAGDTEEARDSISQAYKIYEKQSLMVLPVFLAQNMAARFFIDVEQLKHAIRSETSSDVTHIRKRTYRAGKAAVRNARKYAPYRIKILRQMGLYHWLIGKQGKALKWWRKAIQEGERLNARPDLSRTYFELGKRLLEPESKHKELDGIEAKGYLEKAEILFEEMGLDRDLDDLVGLKADCGL
jgi:tetratricopeptide (TPR) repeat protein